MPYIKQTRRDALWNASVDDRNDKIMTAGELNYFITYLLDEYIQNHGLTYQHINDIIGALEGAKSEFYRRVVVPYEEKKLKENGDVYVASAKRKKRVT
jgi:hypothetical protein